jgi:hypothetical protein
MAFVLVSVASLIISAVMLRASIFSKVTACVGIVANAKLLAYYIGLAFTPLSQTIGVDLYYVSGLLAVVWYILIGQRLVKLS